MNGINQKTNTNQVLTFVEERLASDVSNMSVKRNSAINVFNATVKNLEANSADLKASAERYRALAKVATEKAAEAEKLIADNDTVCEKIYEIIGKPPVQAAA